MILRYSCSLEVRRIDFHGSKPEAYFFYIIFARISKICSQVASRFRILFCPENNNNYIHDGQ
jgi:hypothetical protein